MSKFSLYILFRFLWQMYARWTYALPTQPQFFYLEIQAALLASFRDLTEVATLKLIKNFEQVCLFCSQITIRVQQCGFWDNVCTQSFLPVSRLK